MRQVRSSGTGLGMGKTEYPWVVTTGTGCVTVSNGVTTVTYSGGVVGLVGGLKGLEIPGGVFGVVGFTKLEPPGFGGSMQPAAAITRIKMSPAAIEIASVFIIDAYEHHDLLILFKYPEKLTRLFFFRPASTLSFGNQ